MGAQARFALNVSDDDGGVAYLKLPGHPGNATGIVKRNVCLRDLVGEYEGPDIIFDFDANNRLIGLEIVE